MHYDAQQAVNEDKAKFVDNAIRLTSAQIRDPRDGTHPQDGL